jgi:uridylate kinase
VGVGLAMKVVIKIGGSVIASPLNPELIIQYCRVLRSLKGEGYQIVVVVGGGRAAREFISIAEKLGLSDNDKDEIAISVSRLNAGLIARALKEDGSSEIPLTPEQVNEVLATGKIVVLGGLRPGITTDTVAAIILKSINSKVLLKATDQDGIYDADPRKFPTAKKLDRLSYSDLRKIVSREGHRPGMHGILDPKSIEILELENAKVVVINGSKPQNIPLAIKGRKIGTVVEK